LSVFNRLVRLFLFYCFSSIITSAGDDGGYYRTLIGTDIPIEQRDFRWLEWPF